MTRPSPRDQAIALQRRAARPAASVWVAASAGTGKTTVLTDRVLRLLLDGVAPHRILCLTFTKAAAANMADRINRRLLEWAVMGKTALVDDMTRLLDAAPTTAQRAAARGLFARVVDAPAGLQIDTLHAFCQSVLKRFPVEAGIAPHFDVLDERTQREVLHQARETVLLDADENEDSPLARALGALVELVHETRFDELIAAIVAERGRLEDMTITAGGSERLIARIAGRIGLAVDTRDDDIVAAACADDAFDGDALGRGGTALAGGTKTDSKRAAAIRHWLECTPVARAAGFDDYVRAFVTLKGEPFAKFAGKAVTDAHPDVEDVLRAEAERLLAVIARRRACTTLRATAALIELSRAIVARYEAAKRARAAMDYDDLVLATRRLLRATGGVSWVMYKLDEGIDHILIDEAQDTNPEQWEIVRHLAGDFFAGAGRDDTPSRTVFAVGDAKQSIFSFQRADPAGFEAARADFRDASTAARLEWDEVDLTISFRSTPAILRAVDAVFEAPGAADGVAPGAWPRHEAARLGQAGLVELWPPAIPDDPDEPSPWAPPVEVSATPSPRAQVAELIAARIRAWIDEKEMLESRARPVRPGDVMILVRRRGGFVEEMVRALKKRDVPVAGVDRMTLTDQLAVKDLLALGRFLLLPQDDLNTAAVLKGPLVGLDEAALFEVAYGRGEATVWQALQRRAGDDPRFAAAVARLADLLSRADYVPPYELFADLLGAGGGRAQLLGRLGSEAADPIDEFLNLALDYERVHVPSLQGFLAWLEGGRAEVKRDLEHGRRDEVRVITVHGAKGLQAPIVFLPDTMQVPREQGPRLRWADDVVLWPPTVADEEPVAAALRAESESRAREEHRRLLYVAMTRAEDRLYVCGWQTRKAPDAGCWYQLVANGLAPVAERFDFQAGAAVAAGWSGPGLCLASRQSAPADAVDTDVAAPAPTLLPSWAREHAPVEEAPPRPLAPSRPDAPDPAMLSPLGDDRGLRFRRGLLVHRLLEFLPDLPADSRAAACRAWLARPVHGLDAAIRQDLAAEVLAVLDNPDFAPLFGPAARAEVPLAGLVGGRVISGQVDRLLVEADRVLVVDYKTNRPPPDAPAGVSPVYLAQMAAYRALLREIYPGRRIDCALLWTDGPRLMPLAAEILDSHAP